MGGSEKTEIGKLAAQYCSDNPDLPSRTIARMLRHDSPDTFATLEQARDAVRYARGNAGKTKRKQNPSKVQYRPNGKAGSIVLPVGRKTFKKPLKIKGPLRLLVVSDSHVPYHDETVLEAAIRKGVNEKCDGVYFNGDTLDAYSISRWEKKAEERNFKREVDMTIEVLAEFAKHFEGRWFKVGNHEERYEKYLQQRAEDLIEFTEFELPSVLKLAEMGYGFVESKQWAELGKMPILHGHEFTRGLTAPVNPARGLWNRTASTGMVGHLHRSSTHTEKMSIGGEIIACWSLGCTCNLRPEYAVLNKWNHGWAIVEIASNGEFDVSNYQFIDGKVFRA